MNGPDRPEPPQAAPASKAAQSPPYRFFILAASAILVLVTIAIIALAAGFTPQDALALANSLLEAMAGRPVLLFFAIVLLGGLPTPASLLLIFAGLTFGQRFGYPGAIALTLAAMTLAMTWSYWLAAGPARRLVGWFLRFVRLEIPKIPPRQSFLLVAMLRVTPGVPFFVQNYLPGILRIPFWHYIAISIPIHALYVVGFVLAGERFTEGKFAQAFAAFGLVFAAAVIARLIHLRLKAKVEAQAPAEEDPKPAAPPS
jgi:uncharacterized membrane protein YdjX (TVP38/TMEM64 family)